MASVVMTSAWRSRCRTCDDDRRGLQARAARQTASSTSGGEVRERAHRARELAHRDRLARPLQPRAVALQLGVPERELEAEGHGLGVHAVGAPDHRRRPCARGRASRTASRSAAHVLEDEVARRRA